MEYKGKLYGKVGNHVFPLVHTTDDWEKMEKRIAELEAQTEKSKDKSISIRDLRNDEVFTDFPNYGKHDFTGSHYGSLVVTHELKVLYFYVSYNDDYATIDYSDVTDHFEVKKS